MKARRIWRRELAFHSVELLERRDLPGAWRARTWFERQDFMRKNAGPVICRTHYGVDIVLDPYGDKGVEDSVFRTGSYEPGTLSIIESVLGEGDRFVDIGANVGLMSLVAAKCVGPTGRVDCFEPLPEIRALLHESVEANGFETIVVHPHALGSSRSELKISRHLEINRGSASLAWIGDADNQLEVPIDTLDGSLPGFRERPATMVKIDVEGWEFEVLKGATDVLSHEPQPVLCIEFSTAHPLHGGTLLEMFNYLLAFGYEGYCLEKTKAVASPLRRIGPQAIPAHDNVFFIPARRLGDYRQSLFKV